MFPASGCRYISHLCNGLFESPGIYCKEALQSALCIWNCNTVAKKYLQNIRFESAHFVIHVIECSAHLIYGIFAGTWYFDPGSKSSSDLKTGGLIPPYFSLKIRFVFIFDFYQYFNQTNRNSHQWQLYCSLVIFLLNISQRQASRDKANGKKTTCSFDKIT